MIDILLTLHLLMNRDGMKWKAIKRKGCDNMEMTVHDDRRIVEIWLTNAEKNDKKLRDSLKELYRDYSGRKYLVAVFESGSGDLYANTLSLLQYNRNRFAEKEVETMGANESQPKYL